MLDIDYRDSRPLYEQVADKLERMAVCGVFAPDEQLPSVRQLAGELSINPNTIQRAYGELEKRGVVYAVKGRGNFVSADGDVLRARRLGELQGEMEQCARQARELGADDAALARWVGIRLTKEGKA